MLQVLELKDRFLERVRRKEAVVAVIGLGYVGLPLLMAFNAIGYRVLGVDIDPDKVKALMSGKSYIDHFSDEMVAKMISSGRATASTDFARLTDADAILLCVPTPLDEHRDPDLSYVVNTTKMIAPHLTRGQLVVLESTTYPGTSRDVMQPILEEGSGLKANEDFFVAYSPEREDPGNPNFETAQIPKIVGAATEAAREIALAIYGQLVPKVVSVSTAETAEAVKLTENIFRAVNIALVNELKLIFDDMGIDIWEVIDAAATKPFGFMPFYPGPGLGGHCIPIDPFYLTWKAREFGRYTRFIELAGEINQAMPVHVVSRLAAALSDHSQKAVNGANILLLGLAYKKNVGDIRESPSLVLLEQLEQRGATVAFHDPHVQEIPHTREHDHLAGRRSIDLDPSILATFDAVLIATDHDRIDWSLVAEHAKLIIDTRNAIHKRTKDARARVVKA